jgi:GAF domain-containing protein
MTALSEDEVGDPARKNAELEERLRSAVAERDAAVEWRTAATLEQFRLETELRAALDRQKASAEILRSIGATSGDAAHALRQIAETTAHFFNAPSVTIRIAEGDEWVQDIRVGSGSLASGAHPGSPLIAHRASLPATVYQENRQIHIPDLDNIDPSMAHWPAVATRAVGIRTISGTPLRREGKAIGALIIYRDRLAPFTYEELALQQSFADQAVIAIENARLFNETRQALERQTATSDILKVIASSPSDVAPVFEAILGRALRLCEAAFGFLTIHDGERFDIARHQGVPAALAEYLQAGMDQPRPGDAHWRLLAGEDLIHSPDQKDEDAYRAGNPLRRATVDLGGARSALVVALRKGGSLRGAITIYRKEVRPFSEAQITLLRHFADQAVIAIENVRLFNETKEALERQTATADILKVIASSPSDVQPVFEAIVKSAAKLFEPCAATITTLNGGMLHFNATAALQADFNIDHAKSVYPLPFDPNRAPSARAILGRHIIEIPDTTSPDTPEFTRQAAAAGGFRSITFVPLIHQDNGIGTIILTHPQAGFRLSEKQLALVRTFADQAVIAIENARLFNETQEALERQTATADVLKVIASSPSDVKPVFEAIARRAKSLVGGFSSTVFRFIDGMAHLEAFTPTTPEADEVLRSTFPRPVAEYTPFRMAQAGEVMPIPDTEALKDEIKDIARARGFRSMLFAPLMNKAVSIGFIAVTRIQPLLGSPPATVANLRRPGRDRHRKRPPVRRGAGQDARSYGVAAAADCDRRGAESHQPLGVRSAGRARYAGRVGGAALRGRSRHYREAKGPRASRCRELGDHAREKCVPRSTAIHARRQHRLGAGPAGGTHYPHRGRFRTIGLHARRRFRSGAHTARRAAVARRQTDRCVHADAPACPPVHR